MFRSVARRLRLSTATFAPKRYCPCPSFYSKSKLISIGGQNVQSFHASPFVSLGARRRRRGSKVVRDSSEADEESSNPLKHIPVTDPSKFQHAANDLLSKVEKAVSPMKEKNDVFIVTRSVSELGGDMLTIDLAPGEGSYRIEIMEDEHLFQYTSPISGKVLYVLSSTTGEWVGIEDGHLFEGILVRDLIRQCRGLPNF